MSMELDKYQKNTIPSEPHQNFSYLTYNNLKWENGNLSNSLFNGSIFKDCNFENIIFNNADYEGSHFINCIFTKCSIKSADIHSVFFNLCHFIDVDFDGSNITDTTFTGCKFENSNFENIVLQNSVFDSCELFTFVPHNSSIILNSFVNTKFRFVKLHNVFYYNMFENCTFKDTIFEAYLIGHSYGITVENLQEMHLVLMSEEVDYSISKLKLELENIYKSRCMYLNVGFLNFCIQEESVDAVLFFCLELIKRHLAENVILKNDQIVFLRKLIDSFLLNKKIAPATIYIMQERLASLLQQVNTQNNTDIVKKMMSQIKEFNNAITFKCLELFDQFDFKKDFCITEPLSLIEVKYNKEPTLPLTEILAALAPHLDSPFRLKSKTGSFYEWVVCATEVLPLLDTFINLVSGIIIPFAVLHVANKNTKKTNMPSNELERKEQALTNQLVNNALVISLSKLNSSSLLSEPIANRISTSIQVIEKEKILLDKNKKGYTSTNILEINISSFINSENN